MSSPAQTIAAGVLPAPDATFAMSGKSGFRRVVFNRTGVEFAARFIMGSG